MVCPRCITAVSEILAQQEINVSNVKLGEITLEKPLGSEEFINLQFELKKVGFEIISEKNERIVKQIKAIILKEIFEADSDTHQNLSVTLSEKLHFDYSHLSSIFSRKEGKSIQTFQNELKVERIKELLEYDELSISEIAHNLGFGSAAYLSTQFKKITGMTPSKYKANKQNDRNFLDIY